MKFTTKFMLLMAFVASVVLTSCKDYDEDNYNNAMIAFNKTLSQALADQKAELQKEIDDLNTAIGKIKQCDCDTAATNAAIRNLQSSIVSLQDQINNIEGCKFTKDSVESIILGNTYIKEAHDNAQSALDQISGLQDDIEAKADTADVKKLQDAVEKLSGTVDEINGSVIELQSELNDNISPKVTEMWVWYQNHKDDKGGTIDPQVLKNLADSIINIEKTDSATLMKQINLVSEELSNKYKDVNGRVDGLTNVTATLGELIESLQNANEKLNDSINKLRTDVNALYPRVSALEEATKNLEDARAKQVTGIVIQQVWNPMFGTYSSILTNVETNMLVTYVGNSNGAKEFFSDFDDVDPVDINGDMMYEKANAGKIYVTINPNTVDFTGLKGLTLVNSQDEACAMEIGALQRDTTVLTVGLTRAANNSFYSAEVNLPKANISKAQTITVDKGAVKDAIKALLTKQNLKDIKNGDYATTQTSLKELAGVAYTAVKDLSNIQAQGVKCSWTDAYGDHAVYSNYNIAALKVTPLGFNALNDYSTANYAQKAKNFIKKVYDKVVNNIIDRIDSEKKKYQDKLDARGIRKVDYQNNRIVVTINLKDEDGDVIRDVVTGLKNANAVAELKGEEKPAVFIGDETTAEYTAEVTLSIDETDDIVAAYDANDIVNVSNMAQDLLDLLQEYEDKVQGTKILNKIYTYVDKANNALTKIKNNILQPVLFVNSDKGFGPAGFRGATTSASGEVTIIPTTYNLEIATPIYKKYIKVNDEKGVIYAGNDQAGKEIKVTLKEGLNKIVYCAVDFTGADVTETYYINYTK